MVQVILRRRGYYVSIGEHKSTRTSMTCGVPQGSILAPLLFSMYMKRSFAKTDNSIFFKKNSELTFYLLRIRSNINQTAVGLF